MVGVPFPPIKDPRVIGKEKYSEGLRIENPVTKQLEVSTYVHNNRMTLASNYNFFLFLETLQRRVYVSRSHEND